MRLSSKPSVYIIDALNFVRTFLYNPLADEEKQIAQFMHWLGHTAALNAFAASEFRIVFDGPFRQYPRLLNNNINIYFSDGESADDLILEQALYLKQTGKRVICVSTDQDLLEDLRENGVKTLMCQDFYSLCNKAPLY